MRAERSPIGEPKLTLFGIYAGQRKLSRRGHRLNPAPYWRMAVGEKDGEGVGRQVGEVAGGEHFEHAHQRFTVMGGVEGVAIHQPSSE